MTRRFNVRHSTIAGCVMLLVLEASTGWALSSQSAGGRADVPGRVTGFAIAVPAHPESPDLESPYTVHRVFLEYNASAIQPALLAVIPRTLPITALPGGGRVLGVMPSSSKYIHTPTVAWIEAESANRRYGKVSVPYHGFETTGWISLVGLKLRRTPITVHAYLSRHLMTVSRLGTVILRFRAATGAPSSPTPPGHYFVTDRVPENPFGPYGAFAFGISGIQTRLPPGWGGSDQLAVHGTNSPGTIGMSVSAGCLRVSARVLQELRPLLQLGTPVLIEP
jgi:lipoprotein-anchoring transpeptidase ErfK/SrfK